MHTIQRFTILVLTLISAVCNVSAHPVSLHHTKKAHDALSANLDSKSSLDAREVAQIPLGGQGSKSNSTGATTAIHTLKDLYAGNEKFRQNVRLQAAKVIDEKPSFMFLGCADNRMSPAAIFNAPAGSIMSHNNIGNQYSSRDSSADAAISYAIESGHVQHIIVLGHYGCKAIEMAITRDSIKASRQIKSWIKPIANLYARTRRREIVILRDSRMPRRGLPNGIKAAPPPTDAGYRALVEENVKASVRALHQNDILKNAYSKKGKDSIDVFVHGLVYDESTGDVHDLRVSFGPPGKMIPLIPFQALPAAKNFHRDSSKSGINKGKTWDFGSH
ncbi:carbonic anhydrase [Pholiota conissans]|uniref:Carbonic anhydrase n=1 Tax=Pholiota conissans TaxID=109636 RepID=A0A9P5YMZ2_9AGAR|nr:carbonic anhydrase [Pholiota conissans]